MWICKAFLRPFRCFESWYGFTMAIRGNERNNHYHGHLRTFSPVSLRPDNCPLIGQDFTGLWLAHLGHLRTLEGHVSPVPALRREQPEWLAQARQRVRPAHLRRDSHWSVGQINWSLIGQYYGFWLADMVRLSWPDTGPELEPGTPWSLIEPG